MLGPAVGFPVSVSATCGAKVTVVGEEAGDGDDEEEEEAVEQSPAADEEQEGSGRALGAGGGKEGT